MARQITQTIPRGWKETTLGGVVFPVSDTFNFSGKDKVHFLNTGDILKGKLLHKNLVLVKSLPGQAKKSFKKNDILYSEIRPANKRYMLVNFDSSNSVASTKLMVLRAKDNIDVNFIYKFLIFEEILKEFQLIAESRSGTFPQITFDSISHLFLLLPPFLEQRAIAAVLSSLDNKIELLREENKTLETIAQEIFKEWFVKFRFPGHKKIKMVDSEIGKIPEGWRVGKLVEEGISEFVKTNIDDFSGTKDYVETANVNLSNFVGNFEKITYEKRASRANMQPVENSIWFARMAESRKYLLFQERDWQNIETKILSTGFAGIKCVKDYLYFYWCFILSDLFNDYKNQLAEGAVQVAISNSGIQRILLTLPPREIVKKFTKTVGFCFEKISNNNSQIQTFSTLRDVLLPKLMKGEVRVRDFNKVCKR